MAKRATCFSLIFWMVFFGWVFDYPPAFWKNFFKAKNSYLTKTLKFLLVFFIALGWAFLPISSISNFYTNKLGLNIFPKTEYAYALASQNFTTNGTTTWIVPAGVRTIQAKVWGAGGGGGAGGDASGQNGGGGGGGGFAGASINVTPGSTLSVVVGDNGVGGSATGGSTDCGDGGGGGGFSGVYYNGSGFLIIAGGGAGGGGADTTTEKTGGGGGAGGGGNGSAGLDAAGPRFCNCGT